MIYHLILVDYYHHSFEIVCPRDKYFIRVGIIQVNFYAIPSFRPIFLFVIGSCLSKKLFFSREWSIIYSSFQFFVEISITRINVRIRSLSPRDNRFIRAASSSSMRRAPARGAARRGSESTTGKRRGASRRRRDAVRTESSRVASRGKEEKIARREEREGRKNPARRLLTSRRSRRRERGRSAIDR